MELQVLKAVEAVNEAQKRTLVDKVIARFGSDLTGRRFALWGLAFKPGTDDMREAPSLVVAQGLTARGATVVAYDPVASRRSATPHGRLAGVAFAASAAAAVEGADALVIVTEWKEFRSPDFDAPQAHAAPAGGLRRPQPVRPRADAHRRGSSTTASGGGRRWLRSVNRIRGRMGIW